MSENEETKWRLGATPEEAEEKASDLSSEEDETKEELQQAVQTKAEEIGGGGEGSLVTRPEEVPIAETPKRRERIAKTKRPIVRRGQDSSTDITKISKQLDRQANQLARIEKAILPLQRSVNQLDKQSLTIKQLYTRISQLQRHVGSTKSQGKKTASRSKKIRASRR